jgi:hypothetical protein
MSCDRRCFDKSSVWFDHDECSTCPGRDDGRPRQPNEQPAAMQIASMGITTMIELDRVRKQRDELLKALRPFANTDLTNPDVRDTFGFDVLRARAAIANATDAVSET